MKTNKFSGKGIDDGEWVFGDLISTRPKHGGQLFIVPVGCFSVNGAEIFLGAIHEVDPSTVSQYINKKDAKGREIYEGDYYYEEGVSTFMNKKYEYKNLHVVQFDEEDLCFNARHHCGTSRIDSGIVIEGNIYDNPEVLDEDLRMDNDGRHYGRVGQSFGGI